MYKSFFGFRAKPFNDKPELRFHYVTSGYAENFNVLRKSLRSEIGVHVLTGAHGSGKSLFLQRLVSASKNKDVQYLLNEQPELPLEQTVELVCEQLDLVSTSQPVSEKLQWIQASIRERREQGKIVVFAIDDAHRLQPKVLGELLNFFFAQNDPVLPLVLVGLPALEEMVGSLTAKLGLPAANVYRLEPLDQTDTADYIQQQLRAAGYQGEPIFLPAAVERLNRYGDGSLRELSLLCDASLVVAHLHSSYQVTPEIVDEAAQQHNIDTENQTEDAEAAADSADQDAEDFLKQIAAEQEALQNGRPNPRFAAQKEQTAESKTAGESLFVSEAEQLAAGDDSLLVRHLPVAAGLGLILCAGVVASIYLLQSPARAPADPAVVAADPAPDATAQRGAASATSQALNPPPVADAAPAGLAAPTEAAPREGAGAGSVAGDDQAAPDAGQTRTAGAAPATGEAPAVPRSQPPAETAVAERGDEQRTPDARTTQSVTVPAPATTVISTAAPTAPAVDIPEPAREEDPRVQDMLRLAGAQIRAQQLVEPEGDNALQTFLDILQTDPENQAGLTGVRQISEYYLNQIETARKTREHLYRQADQARQQQQEYLNQFALAKQEKETYLRDINAYYLGQAILANRYKVDSLIQAETAQQNTQNYLERLSGRLRPQRPPAQPEASISHSAMLTNEQALNAEGRITRLLSRARQQIRDKRLVKPKRNNALSTYRQVLRIAPGNPEAIEGLEHIMDQYLSWAASQAARGNPQRAKQLFDQAMEIAPDSINLQQKIRNVRQQVAILDQATSARPGQGESPAERGPFNLNNSPELAEALLHSARLGDAASVATLLSSGASADLADLLGNTPLMAAAKGGHLLAAEILLRRGAKPNRGNSFGETPLVLAAEQGSLEMVELLLTYGASPHSRDADGRTPLMGAAAGGYTDIVRRLLARSADPDVRSKSGRTALMAAAWNGHGDIVRLLLDYGVDVDLTNDDGWTALSHAAWQGHADVVRTLLERGASAAIPNNNGQTPLTMAYNRGHADIVSLLQ